MKQNIEINHLALFPNFYSFKKEILEKRLENQNGIFMGFDDVQNKQTYKQINSIYKHLRRTSIYNAISIDIYILLNTHMHTCTHTNKMRKHRNYISHISIFIYYYYYIVIVICNNHHQRFVTTHKSENFLKDSETVFSDILAYFFFSLLISISWNTFSIDCIWQYVYYRVGPLREQQQQMIERK